jgi:hypothetical protein
VGINRIISIFAKLINSIKNSVEGEFGECPYFFFFWYAVYHQPPIITYCCMRGLYTTRGSQEPVSLTWIKAAFNNNATALWRPSWWDSATAGHNFGRGPSNEYSIKVWF